MSISSDRPADAVGFGHHPDGRPDALHAIESGADFYVAILEGEGFQEYTLRRRMFWPVRSGWFE